MNTIHLNQIGDKVIVKKGEGGGGSNGGIKLRYFKSSAMGGGILMYSILAKYKVLNKEEIWSIAPSITYLSDATLEHAIARVCAVAVDFDLRFFIGDSWFTLKDALGSEFEQILPYEITEEEFFDSTNLNA